MTKADYIKHWLKTSKKDWERSEYLFERKDYVFALFCVHLSIEKLAKAVWVKEHKDDFPPKIHNLINLFARTSLNLSDEQHQLLNQLNFFQIEGRYPDYNSKANKVASRKHTKELIRRANRFQKWVLKQMQ